jgi:hypothetical protein
LFDERRFIDIVLTACIGTETVILTACVGTETVILTACIGTETVILTACIGTETVILGLSCDLNNTLKEKEILYEEDSSIDSSPHLQYQMRICTLQGWRLHQLVWGPLATLERMPHPSPPPHTVTVLGSDR